MFGDGVVVHPFTNLYGCRIGSRTRIGTFVEVQRGASIGEDCKIQSHTLGSNATILGGVRIGRNATVGAGAVVTSDVPVGGTVAGNPARLIDPGRGRSLARAAAR